MAENLTSQNNFNAKKYAALSTSILAFAGVVHFGSRDLPGMTVATRAAAEHGKLDIPMPEDLRVQLVDGSIAVQQPSDPELKMEWLGSLGVVSFPVDRKATKARHKSHKTAKAMPHTHAATQSPIDIALAQLPDVKNKVRIFTSTELQRLRHCESTDDYSNVNPNGYYGAYQFNQAAWADTGAAKEFAPSANQASAAEQDAAAIELGEMRGIEPWQCGYVIGN